MSDLITVLIYGIAQGGLYCLVGLGLTYTFGITRILNFAYGELVTIGAFGAILLSPHMSAFLGTHNGGVFLGIVLSVVLVSGISAVLYLFVFRYTVGNYLQGLAVSLGLLLVIENYLVREYSTTPRRGPGVSTIVDIGSVRLAASQLIVLGVTVVIVAFFAVVVKKSWIGVALRACGDDEFAASTLGMTARRLGFYAFVVAGVLGAAAGIATGSLYPVTTYSGTDALLKGFVVVVIGGLGSATGAAAAGVALGVLEALGSRYINPSLTDAYAFGFMIVVLMIAPDGLFNREVRRAG